MERQGGRARIVIRFLIYILVYFHPFENVVTAKVRMVDSQKVPLDAYCANRTSMNYSYSSKPRLEKYQRICRDADSYIACIINNRASRLTTLPFEVQPFERFFPGENDLAVATYMLCSQNLLQLQVIFDKDALNCERQCDTTLCMGRSREDIFMLEDAINVFPMNMDRIRNLSCKIAAPLTNCIEMQYVRCDSKYQQLKDYELGKLGGACLVSQNLHSPYVTDSMCDSTSIHYTHQRAVMSMLSVFVILFVTNL